MKNVINVLFVVAVCQIFAVGCCCRKDGSCGREAEGAACGSTSGANAATGIQAASPAVNSENQMIFITDEAITGTVAKLVEKHGEAARARIEKGVRQVAAYWNQKDGSVEEFESFCMEQFIADPAALTMLLDRFRVAMESISGHAVAMTRKLREPVDLATFQTLPVDLLFATLNPFDHLSEDFFTTKVAFVGLLNFPLLDTSEPLELSRREWAEARLAQTFARRIPGEVALGATRAYAAAEDYIARYNIHMGGVQNQDGSNPFPADLKLISHWGLRDHIKGMYSDPVGNLPNQQTILQIMNRIVNQEIPAAVVDAPGLTWNPWTNELKDAEGKAVDAAREPDTRYARILEVFRAEQQIDKYSPLYPTLIDRRFKLDREIREERVRRMLETVISSPTTKKVAALVRKRLGRDLQPFDIWYDGFKNRASLNEDLLTKKVSALYRGVNDFRADLPNVLGKLGFEPETAAFLQQHIEVDPARGAGHAMGAGMRTDSAHLRTRVPESGMDYKGYNIALHELGHCVEQVFSLNRVDDTLLDGVPNTAFTEAFAFVFQSRDLDVLGEANPDPEVMAMRSLDLLWSTVEIGSVGLLDMQMWRWLYDHPDATPAQLRDAVVSMAKELWNKYFEPMFGIKDSPILAIYSHMVAYGLYLPDYSVGFMIQAQIEAFLKGDDLATIKGRNLAREMERMCVQGRISPDVWMKGAVGSELSPDAMLKAAEDALAVVERGQAGALEAR